MSAGVASGVFTAFVYGLVPLAGAVTVVFWAVRAVRSRRRRPQRSQP